MFADVVGSTSLVERLEPESARRVLDRYFEVMHAIVERHGGTVEKYIGDALMAVFGIPTLHEDDALRAVRAAEDMRDALTALNDELGGSFGVTVDMRIGVATGEVVARDPALGQAFVTGDAVNVAHGSRRPPSPATSSSMSRRFTAHAQPSARSRSVTSPSRERPSRSRSTGCLSSTPRRLDASTRPSSDA